MTKNWDKREISGVLGSFAGQNVRLFLSRNTCWINGTLVKARRLPGASQVWRVEATEVFGAYSVIFHTESVMNISVDTRLDGRVLPEIWLRI